MDDLFTPTSPPNLGAPKSRTCSHPRRDRRIFEGGIACGRCGREITAEASRRGRTSRRRGNDIERSVARQLGLERVGQYGGPDDVRGEMFVVQVKSGAAFPERFWRWLTALPTNAGQTPLLVITDAPGPGHKRRAIVVLDIDAWIALHGPSGMEGATE